MDPKLIFCPSTRQYVRQGDTPSSSYRSNANATTDGFFPRIQDQRQHVMHRAQPSSNQSIPSATQPNSCPSSMDPRLMFCPSTLQHVRQGATPSSYYSNPNAMRTVDGLCPRIQDQRQYVMQRAQPSSQQSNPSAAADGRFSLQTQYQRENFTQRAPPSSSPSNPSAVVNGPFLQRSAPPPSSLLNQNAIDGVIPQIQDQRQHVMQRVQPSSFRSNTSAAVDGRFSLLQTQDRRQIFMQRSAPPPSSLLNRSAPVNGLSSLSTQDQRRPHVTQGAPPSCGLPNRNSIVPGQYLNCLPQSQQQNMRQTMQASSSLGNTSLGLGQSFSSFGYPDVRQAISPSSYLSNRGSMVHGQFRSPLGGQNARKIPRPYSRLSNTATGATSGYISTELLPSSSVSNDKAMLGTRLTPIEIPDSPGRENSTDQHDQNQSTRKAKRAREEESEVEDCSDPIKTKKPKLMHQSQNKSITRPQNENELPSPQISLDDSNLIAASDDVQIVHNLEKESKLPSIEDLSKLLSSPTAEEERVNNWVNDANWMESFENVDHFFGFDAPKEFDRGEDVLYLDLNIFGHQDHPRLSSGDI